MSRTMRKRLLETVDLMKQGIQAVEKMRQRQQYEDCLTLLSDCQELAVAFGTKIEQNRGMNTETVAALEEFCEGLYQASVDVSETEEENNGEKVEAGTVAKSISATADVGNKLQTSEGNGTADVLHSQWEAVEKAFEQDMLDKKEVVFLPYKASMWDSLESVYLAAREDPECEAYCVPIPYYDLNPDGSFGEMHYEGDEYPKNIEITDWRQYDLEARMPDEIYIHNPYDEFNLVTSVHPQYYAKKLKEYTDMLVYIPYFVLGEIEPDDQDAIDGMKHFIWTPGVIFADRVVVQSEKMKQIYVNEYLKAAKENRMTGNHLNREYLEKKILGTGSPKLEKIANTRKEDLDIPKEWLKVIQKPDGSWKKIVFYNTGVSSLLAHNENWVNKVENSLKVFKEKQDCVVLLWRPHPLLENTMRTMRPEILQSYIQIKDRFIEEDWGIYDDTTDMDRAIVLSDAYYGDGSSLVQLYQNTGKPIMLQNTEIIYSVSEEE